MTEKAPKTKKATKPFPVSHFENVNISINPQDASVTAAITELARAAAENGKAIAAIAAIAKGPTNITGLSINNSQS